MPLLDCKPYVPDFKFRTGVKVGWYGPRNKDVSLNEYFNWWCDSFIAGIFMADSRLMGEEFKEYRFHFRGFLHGTVYSILGGAVIAGIVSKI